MKARRNVSSTRSAYRTSSLLARRFLFRSLWRSPTLLFTSRRDTTYRLILIIAPRRRDASNRLPHHAQAESNCNRSSIDQPRPLAVVIADVHRSSTASNFFSRTLFSIFLIALRRSFFLDRSFNQSLARSQSYSQLSSWQIVSATCQGVVIQLEDRWRDRWNWFYQSFWLIKDT